MIKAWKLTYTQIKLSLYQIRLGATFGKRDKDHQQCSLSLVVISEIANLTSRLGTNGLAIQWDSSKIETSKLVMCMKNWNTIGFVIFTCHIFSSSSFWVNLLLFWFSLIVYCFNAGSVPCPACKLMVSVLTTGDCENCWWFLLATIVLKFSAPNYAIDGSCNSLSSERHKPLSGSMLAYCPLDPWEHILVRLESKYNLLE